jgi:prepilin-type N-terminal cleavage/methylation domain-containing protein
MTKLRDREGGFTLMELLLVIALLGLVAVPLAGAITVGERTTAATANRLESTHDAQLVSIYLPADIQSAGNAAGDVVVTPGNSDCSGMPNLLRLRWTVTETLGVQSTYQVAYAVTQSGDEWRLTRFYCPASPGAPTQVVVARNLSGASQPTPVVSPDGKTISVTLKESGAQRDPTQWTYTISGRRRTTT